TRFHVTGVQTCALPISLHAAAPQRLVKVLPMDVEKHFSQFLQALERHIIAVDERAGPSILSDHAAQQAFVISIHSLLCQPFPRRSVSGDVEVGAEFSAFGSATHEARTAALA